MYVNILFCMFSLPTWFNQLLVKLNLLPNQKPVKPTKTGRKRGRKKTK